MSFSDCCDPLSFIIPVANQSNTFLVGLGPAIGLVRWDGCSNRAEYRYLKTIDKTPGNRLNDAKADASGRLWVGKY
jgi:gluconolactonase